MSSWSMGWAVVLSLVVTPLWAGQQVPEHIPRTYISPGASGSIGTSERHERYDLYGGQRIPGTTHQESQYGTQSIETRGGIRQTIEYPGGHVIERTPGQGSYSRERSR